MEDQHLLSLVKDLLLEIGFHKKDILGLEEAKSNFVKIQKENLSKFYVEPDLNSPKTRLQSSDVKALNLSPRFTALPTKKVDKYLQPFSKKLSGKSVRRVKHDDKISVATNLSLGDTNKIRRYKKITKVFGTGIDDLPCTNTYLQDGMVIFIPEIVYQLSNVILKDVSVEGIFRKAGSAQRQNNAKDIINSGQQLPDFIHAIDAACLLKFFLRSLPIPLLSSNVLQLMSKCLTLPAEKIEIGLALSVLVIPRIQRHILSYVLEILHTVSSSENANRMDASNLAIVLAPNFLSSIFRRQRRGWAFSTNDKDDVLPSTIAIIEALIKMAHKVGRIPQILEEKIKSIYSVENVEMIVANSSKKKRRSGSLQRLFSGLRKVVQGPSSSEEHLFNSFKPKSRRQSAERSANNSDVEAEVAASTNAVAKRKSIVLDDELFGKEAATLAPCIGKPRLSLEDSNPPDLPPRKATRQQGPHFPFDALAHTVQPKIMRPCRRDISVHGRYSLRDRVLASNSATHKRNFAIPVRRQSLRLAGISPRDSPGRLSDYNLRERKYSPKYTTGGCRSAESNKNRVGCKDLAVTPMLRAKSDMCRDTPNKSAINPCQSPRNGIVPRRNCAASFVDLVQSNYEAVKLESKNLDSSTCESLSRRLSKELKLRSRRSSEYKVQRSPSERRISNIRRRSKEATPRQSPARDPDSSPYSLRRGKPNTLASGLPLLSKPLNPADFKDCDKYLKLRARSVSLIVNTSGEPFTTKELSFPLDQKSPSDTSSGLGRILAGSNTVSSEEMVSSDNSDSQLSPLFAEPVISDDENLDWVPALEANLDKGVFRTPMRPLLDLSHHRMSIDALKRQRKVTATLKLFNGTGNTPRHSRGPVCHTPTIKSARGTVGPVFRTPRSRLTPLMNNNCFQGQSGFTPLPPKAFRPKRLLDDQSRTRSNAKSLQGSNFR